MSKSDVQSKFDAFLSYNWASKNIALSLFNKLTSIGLKIWMDDSQLDNRILYEQLTEGINNSKMLICCITKKYSESENCIREINFACVNKTPLIIAMLEDLDISKIGSVGFIIASLTRFNFFEEKTISQYWSGKVFESMIKSIQSNITKYDEDIPKSKIEEFNKSEISLSNGDKYIGSFQDGKQSGFGTYIYQNKNEKYEGEFLNGKKNGVGKYFYATGDVYQGEWINDMKNGHGVLTFKSGAKYIGEYLNNLKNGYGKYIYR